MGGVATGFATHKPGFGMPGAPAPPVAQTWMNPQNAPMMNPTVPEVPAPTHFLSEPTPRLEFPEIPPTTEVGKPEMAAIVVRDSVHYSKMWFGTEDERIGIRAILAEWADTVKADVLVFFAANRVLYRPPSRLQEVGGVEYVGAAVAETDSRG